MNLQKILTWLEEHVLVWCANCSSVHFKKNMKFVATRWNTVVELCKDCYRDFYCPWTDL